MRKFIGNITIKSGEVVCSDPCYKSGTWCADRCKALNGLYNVYVVEYNDGDWGRRNAFLEIIHTDFDKKKETDILLWENGDATLGVDSGTFGFFDKEYYDKYHENDTDDDWYEKFVCGEIDKNEYITENLGVWSCSGYGDGSYNLDVIYHPTEECYVGFRAIFIDDDDAWDAYNRGVSVPPTKDMWRFKKEDGDTSWFEFEKLNLEGNILIMEIDMLVKEAQNFNVSEEHFEDLITARDCVDKFKSKMLRCMMNIEISNNYK